jgi:hypothetical protein
MRSPQISLVTASSFAVHLAAVFSTSSLAVVALVAIVALALTSRESHFEDFGSDILVLFASTRHLYGSQVVNLSQLDPSSSPPPPSPHLVQSSPRTRIPLDRPLPWATAAPY